MRSLLKERELISCEVSKVNQNNGKIELQTRNYQRMGKLTNGFLVKINHNFIRRMKSHMIDFFEKTVKVIVGKNGYVWIFSPTKEVDFELRARMTLVRGAFLCLQDEKLSVFKQSVESVMDKLVENEINPKEMKKHSSVLCEGARTLIENEMELEKSIELKFLQQKEMESLNGNFLKD